MTKVISELSNVEKRIEKTRNDIDVMVTQLREDINKLSAYEIVTFVPTKIEAIRKSNEDLARYIELQNMLIWVAE